MTIDCRDAERKITEVLGELRPVAVAYLDAAPAGVNRFEGSVPSGCTFWNLAARGESFYTVPADHFNCAIGSYTHAIDLPAHRASELDQTLTFMTSIGYLRMEEVPTIPRLPRTPPYTYYAPLAAATVNPDVAIFTGRPAQLMRLQEASIRSGAAAALPLLGRPTCMALPAAMAHGSVMSTGCIGNRVYTGLGDDELYVAIPGARLMDIAEALLVIAKANDVLDQYHCDRRQTLTAPPR
jgi:uncharacterized protein (DUF169 family)